MTKQELEQQHPELAAELRAEGASAERGRYDGHVALGRQSGALTMALADYEAGKPVTESLAAHMDHAIRGRLLQDRLDDDAAAAAATSHLVVGGSQPDSNAGVAAAVERISGDMRHAVHR
jgi:hypothetical protein